MHFDLLQVILNGINIILIQHNTFILQSHSYIKIFKIIFKINNTKFECFTTLKFTFWKTLFF